MKKFAFAACFVLLFLCISNAQVTIIPYNATWKYLDNGTNQGTAWRSVSFSDATWKTGAGKFGYGISDANTIISYGPDRQNKFVTTYFRKTVSILDPAAFAFYEANIKRDDGVVVYVNGTEVYRSNMPTGVISYTTHASTAASGNGSTGQPFNISSSRFVAGANVIAVEIHQQKIGTAETDMAFDFNLANIPPFISSISRQSPTSTTTNATSVVFRSVFSEKVTGVDRSDFNTTVLTGNLTGNITGVAPVGTDGTTYDVTVSSILGNGILRLDLKSTGTGITDAGGNAITGGFTNGQTYTISQSAPTLTSATIASNNTTASLAKPGDIISLNFTASEPINPPAVTIATHTVTATPGNSNSFTATYTMTAVDAQGIVPFSINFSNTINTPGTKVTTTTNNSSVSFDNIVPAIVSINRQSPATDPTSATSVIFRASFSEAVIGVDVLDFTLNIGGTATGVLSSVSSVDGSVYDITVSDVSGIGTLDLDLNATGTGITDPAGNSIAGGFTAGQTYTIQQGIPYLTSVSIASDNPAPSLAKPGDIISLNFTASDLINPPSITIATHTVTATAGSGNSFTANYTMSVSDASGTVPFSIDFISALGVPGSQVTATTDGSNVSFDKTNPSVVSVNRKNPSTSTTNATTVTFRVTFSEQVSGVNTPDFNLTTTNTAVGTISTVVASSPGVYDITVSSVAGNGTLRLNLNSSSTGIIDAAGNTISGGFALGQIYTIQQIPGFSSVTQLSPINITQTTQDKPQAKVWNYANKWWCVLSASAGTTVFRLDGTSWTSILTLNSSTSKPDCWVVGNLVHILVYRGNSVNSYIYTLEYNSTLNTYEPWHSKPGGTLLKFPSGSETATIVVDGSGRMWASTAGVSEVSVWWCDFPYDTWSAPITVATGVLDDDICTLTAIPNQGKIGIFWSNQNTKRFGFRTHTDGASPNSWSADESPASQSALDNLGAAYGFADDHMNIKVSSDGTLYCAAKTSYDHSGYQKLILLVRRPAGTWDNSYTVTMYAEGTQPLLLLNEVQGKLKAVYTTVESGGNIVYRESPTSAISFGSAITLIKSSGKLYNYATSSHQNYVSEVVIMATDVDSSQMQAVSVLAFDGSSSSAKSSVISLAKKSELPELFNTGRTEPVIQAYPNPFNSGTDLRFTLPYTAAYQLTMYDSRGIKLSVLKKGWADAGVSYSVKLNGVGLTNGLYFITLQSGASTKTIKVLLQK